MQWFRLYDDLLDDPKAQKLRPELFKHWINLLCLANKESPRGTLPNIKAIAFRLRLSEAKTAGIIRELVDAKLIDSDDVTLRPHNWDDRQKRSDNVAARVAKHRSNVTETLPVTDVKQVGNVLDTDTDTEKKREEEIPPKPPRGVSRETRISDDFAVDDDMSSWAKSKGFSQPEIDHHTEAFIAYWRGEGGPKSKKIDWRQAWQTWLLREKPGRWPGAPVPIRGAPPKPTLPPMLERGKVTVESVYGDWYDQGGN